MKNVSFFFLSIHTEQLFQYQNKKDDSNHEPNLDYVLDITIAYPDNGEPLDLPTIVSGTRPPCKTNFLYRLYHSSEVTFVVVVVLFRLNRYYSARSDFFAKNN